MNTYVEKVADKYLEDFGVPAFLVKLYFNNNYQALANYLVDINW